MLLGDLAGAPLAPLLDLPASHLSDAMGLVPRALTEAAFGGGPISYLGDACGAVAALPAGHGELGKHAIAAVKAREQGAIVFRPWPALRTEELVAGLAALR